MATDSKMKIGGWEEKEAIIQYWSEGRYQGCENGHHGGKGVVDDCCLFGETVMDLMAATSSALR